MIRTSLLFALALLQTPPHHLRLLVPPPVIDINPGDDLVAAMASAAAPAIFHLKTGLHRVRPYTYGGVTPRTGDTFIGDEGTIVSGAVQMTSFTTTTNLLGTVYYASGVTDAMLTNGQCEAGYPRCIYAEDVYIDNVLQKHVATVDDVTTGTFHYDYTAHRVYIGVNPSGKDVEQARAVRFTDESSTAARVTFTGLTFQMFANPAQGGVIIAKNAGEWQLDGNTFRWNHGYGYSIGPAMHAQHNRSWFNGQAGFGGGPDTVLLAGVVVEYEEFASNNTAHFDPAWEGGGGKVSYTNGIILRGIYSHDNRGPGLWTDIENINALYENNRIEDNYGPGIYHEISEAAIIRNNTLKRNGLGTADYGFGACIIISASRDTEVSGNLCVDNGDGIIGLQQSRGSGSYGPYLVQNLNVHDNIVQMTASLDPSGNLGWNGLLDSDGNTAPYTSRNNHFEANAYYLPSNGAFFTWNNTTMNFAGFQATGNDEPDGSMTIGTIP